MGTYRYLHDAGEVKSHSLAPGTNANHAICEALGLSFYSTVAEISEALSDNGWWFEIEGDIITGISGDDDREIPDPEELEKFASIFQSGSWFTWECEGELTKMLFQEGKITWGDEIRRLFAPETYSGTDLQTEIEWVEDHLNKLKARSHANQT